jgi:hypothetical protein
MLDFSARYSIEQGGPEAPLLFVREILGADPDPWQVKVLMAYGRGERRISVVSGHGVGKSAVASWIAVHHLLTRYPQKTVVTAPSSPQLFDVLFAEIKAWIGRMRPELQSLVEVKGERIELKARPETSFVTARTSRPDQPEAIAGIHSENVLILADEASGIPEKVFEAGSGSMSGHTATTILLGNPVRSSGLFYETHHKLRDKWWTLRVSCEDSPRVSKDYIEDMRTRYGERSNAFRVRVLGLFPLADDDTIIPWDLVESAQGREVAANPRAPIVWGLDVARFGNDSTALIKRQANVVPMPAQVWRGLDTMQVAGRVMAEWEATSPDARPIEILIDVIGIGAGVTDRLRELGLPARGVNVSESPAMGERYRNLRSELWWAAKEWLGKLDCRLPADETLAKELITPKYTITSNGKIQVESKDDMKKRGYESPNVADAFILTFASTAATATHGLAGALSWAKPILRGLKGTA